MIHLSEKALAWLKGGYALQLKVETGMVACHGRADSFDGWCTAGDVRAMVRGWQYAYSYRRYPDELQRSPVQRPTCPECCVLLDQALETTKQGSVADQPTDATEAMYKTFKEHQDNDDSRDFDEYFTPW